MKKVSILFLILVTFCSINLFAAKNLYLSYTKTPTNIYKNQKFEIKIEAMITTSNFTNISTKFLNSSNIEVLNPNSSWKKISNDKYENSYYFKVKNTTLTTPGAASIF